jgi:cytochrome c-type biogenesis protein CcsB
VGLAQLSNTLFTLAIVAYSLVLIALGAEYAFGRRGLVARTARRPERERVLVGAGGGVVDEADASVGDAASVEDSASVGEPPASDRAPVGPDGEPPAEGLAAVADRCGRLGVVLAVIGALLHATSVSIRGAAVDRLPWGNMYEFTSLATLVAVVAFLAVLVKQPRLRHLGVFVMLPVIILMFLAGTVLYAKAEALVPALHSYWLAIHVTAAAVGTGIFLVSSVATGLYLVRLRADRTAAAGAGAGRLADVGSRLPAAGALDRMAYRTAAFGFPIYTFGIICGAIWAEAAWGKYWSWDPKETWALVSWVVYAAYLHARATAGWKGRGAAWINLVGFGTLVFNFFVVNIVISGLHSYAGLN